MRRLEEILIDLIKYKGNLDGLVLELSQYPWDSDIEVVTMSIDDMLSVLFNFFDKQITSEELEAWANELECREDIGYESERVMDAIDKLANPELYGSLSENQVDSIRSELIS